MERPNRRSWALIDRTSPPREGPCVTLGGDVLPGVAVERHPVAPLEQLPHVLAVELLLRLVVEVLRDVGQSELQAVPLGRKVNAVEAAARLWNKSAASPRKRLPKTSIRR